jgi:hypothetical protein
MLWTNAENTYLREQYGKHTYAKIALSLGRTTYAVREHAKRQKILKPRIVEPGGVPMQKALSPDECAKMRGFLRTWLHYGKACGNVSAGRFLKAWREAEFGRAKLIVPVASTMPPEGTTFAV